jgi:hypothetical protein
MKNSFRVASVSFLTVMALSPVVVSAQTNDDLRNTIQNSVLSDPRVASIPPDQLAGLIDALVAEARSKNMTSADILTKPQQAAAASSFSVNQTPSAACATGWQGYLCEFNQVFGFEGNNYEIPVFILVTTAFLIAVIWEMILHHRKKLAKAAAKKSPPWENMPK